MASEKSNGEVKPLAAMTEVELERVLDRAPVTSVYSHGDLVYEPGMSREEERIRSRYAVWRHAYEGELDKTMAQLISIGAMTPEEAEKNKARQRAQAEEDRIYVERADAARAERLKANAKPRDDGPTR